VLIEEADIRGDVHMHTVETDGKNTIREMAEAGLARGYEYSRSRSLEEPGDDDGAGRQAGVEHIERIRAVDKEMTGRIRVLAGIEVDVLADGELDLSDEVLAQMDVVIASVHSLFNMPAEEMTMRMLRAIENPYVRILGIRRGGCCCGGSLTRWTWKLYCGARESWALRSSIMRILTGLICAIATCGWRRTGLPHRDQHRRASCESSCENAYGVRQFGGRGSASRTC